MNQGAKMLVLSAFSWSPVHAVRLLSLRLAGAQIGADVVLHHGYQVRGARKLTVGADSSVGERAVLDARGGLSIGESVNVSSEVQIWSAQHDWKSPSFAYMERAVEIGNHVWLGPRVVVLPGSKIGDGVVVAAGAVVRGELAPWGLYAGVPARRIGERPRGLDYRLGGAARKLWFW